MGESKSHSLMNTRIWIIYTRVSTDEQAQEGVSLIAQREACTHLLQALGHKEWTVVEDPGLSGKDNKRPGMQRILAGIGAGEIAGVVVWKFDRLTRSLRDLIDFVALCDKHQVAFRSVCEQVDTSGPMGRMVLHLLGAVAQYVRESIAANVKAAKTHIRIHGGWSGGPVPAGCRVVGTKGRFRLEADPDAGPIVSQAWTRIIAGGTLAGVGAWLGTQGISGPRARAWNAQNLRHLLGGQQVVGLLVDKATQRQAIEVLAGRTAPTAGTHAKRSDRVWPLAKIARCALCGNAMVGVHCRGRHGAGYPYLRCAGRRKGACKAADLPAAAWEGVVMDALARAMAPGGELERLLVTEAASQRTMSEPTRQRRAELVLQADGLRERIARLLDLVAGGDAPGRSVRATLADLEDQLDKAETAIAGCDGDLAGAALTGQQIQAMLETVRGGIAELRTKTAEIQAQVLSTTVKEASIGAGQDLKITLWRPGTPEGFVQNRKLVQRRATNTNPLEIVFKVNAERILRTNRTQLSLR